MIYFWNYGILYLKTCVSVYFSIFYSYVLYGCLVWSSTQCNIDSIITLQKRCIWFITYSELTEHTGPLFSELRLLKIKDILSLTKILFIFDFINENVPKGLNAIFVINRLIHSYETCSSMLFLIPKAKTSRFHLNTLRYDGADLWNNFIMHFIMHCYIKNLIWQNESLKSYFKCISWTLALVLNTFSSNFRLFCFVFFSVLLQPK